MSGHGYANGFKIKVHQTITISSGTNTGALSSVVILHRASLREIVKRCGLCK